MPFLAPIAAIAGTAASAIGGLATSSAQSASANYQSQIAQNNATLAGMQAANAIGAGHEQTYEKSLQGSEQMGRIKAAMGANGVDVNTGSNVDVLASQRAENLLATQTTLSNAAKAAWGYENQALSYGDQASLERSAAQNDRTAGLFGAASGVFSGLKDIPGLGTVSTGLFGSASPTAVDWDNVPDDAFNLA